MEAEVNTTLTSVTALGPVCLPLLEQGSRTRGGSRALTEAEQRRLLRAAKACDKSRDRAIVELMYDTGIRVSELAALDVVDLSVTRTAMVQVGDRGHGPPRELPLTARTRSAVRTWLGIRATLPSADSPALWLSRLGTRMTTRSLRAVITQVGAAAALQLSPHTLRQTAAARWLGADLDLVTVAELLGHAWVETTRLYSDHGGAHHHTDAVERSRT
jgi:integrase/recombinase XerC